MINGCIRGEYLAQNYLFKKYSPKVFYICRKYSKSYEDAQDSFQEAFIKIYKYISSYRGTGSFEGWVSKIAKTTSVKKYSNLRSKKEIILNIPEEFPENFESPSVFNKLEIKHVNSIVETLPIGYKTVLELYMDGYKHDEISTLLGIKAATSRSQLAKARRMLTEKINKN